MNAEEQEQVEQAQTEVEDQIEQEDQLEDVNSIPNLATDHHQAHRELHTSQADQLSSAVVVEFGVDDSLHEGPEPIDIGHEEECPFNPVEVIQEVLGQLAVQVVHEEEPAHSEEHHEEHEEEHQREVDFVGEVEAEHGVEVPEAQEGEELNVALQAHEAEEAPEREHP